MDRNDKYFMIQNFAISMDNFKDICKIAEELNVDPHDVMSTVYHMGYILLQGSTSVTDGKRQYPSDVRYIVNKYHKINEDDCNVTKVTEFDWRNRKDVLDD